VKIRMAQNLYHELHGLEKEAGKQERGKGNKKGGRRK
jgi:hypothetical protein